MENVICGSIYIALYYKITTTTQSQIERVAWSTKLYKGRGNKYAKNHKTTTRRETKMASEN